MNILIFQCALQNAAYMLSINEKGFASSVTHYWLAKEVHSYLYLCRVLETKRTKEMLLEG